MNFTKTTKTQVKQLSVSFISTAAKQKNIIHFYFIKVPNLVQHWFNSYFSWPLPTGNVLKLCILIYKKGMVIYKN